MTVTADTWTVRRIVGTMLPLLFILSLLEIAGGLFLEQFKSSLLNNPSLLIVLPVMIGMGGNLGSILAARISTALHLGTMEVTIRDRLVLSNGIAIVALAGTMSAFVAGAAHVIGSMYGEGALSFLHLLLVTMASGVTLSVFVVLVAVSVTIVSYRQGIDPDDTAIPVVTNLCDIMGVLILLGYVVALV